MLIITIGISGSGKNHLISELRDKLQFTVVEPDDIRRKKLGNVSNQENGNVIFAIAKSKINKALKNNENVIFNATNLEWKRNIKFVLDLDKSEKTPVLFVFMTDSVDLNKCKHRVKKDLENNIDRSKVPEEVMDKQHTRYMKCYQDARLHTELNIDSCPENWYIFDYFKINELIYKIKEIENGNN
jgi:predicted kinase